MTFWARAQHPIHEHARDRLPRWRGWVAKPYGPGAAHQIPRQAKLAWHIESRAFFKSMQNPWWTAGRTIARKSKPNNR